MSFKSLFLTDESETPKSEVKQTESKFPTTQTPSVGQSFPTTPFPNVAPVGQSFSNNEYLAKFTQIYQAGFDSLNQAGYDFYEFFQAITTSGGIDNPQMYVMAMSMGSAMDKNNNKTKLLTQADYYLNELTKIYNQHVANGTTKKQELVTQKNAENHNLTTELANLREQLQAINNQIQSRETQLSSIDNKYLPLISDIDNKLSANETAKNMLVDNITKVKTELIIT